MGEAGFDRLYLLEFIVFESKFHQNSADAGLTRVIFLSDSFPLLEVTNEALSTYKTVFNRGKSCLFGIPYGVERFASNKVKIVVSRKSVGPSYFNVGTAYLKLSPDFLAVLTSQGTCSKCLKVSLDLLNGLMEVVGDISINLRLSYLGQNIVTQMHKDGTADLKTMSLKNYYNSFIPVSETNSQYIPNDSQTRQNYQGFNNLMNSSMPAFPYTVLPATVNYSQTYYMPPNNQIPPYGFMTPYSNPNAFDWNNLPPNYTNYNPSDWFNSNYMKRATNQNTTAPPLPETASLNNLDANKPVVGSEPRELVFRETLAAKTSENILFKRKIDVKLKESHRPYPAKATQLIRPVWNYSPVTKVKKCV